MAGKLAHPYVRRVVTGWGAEVIYRQDETRETILTVIGAITDAAQLLVRRGTTN